MPQPFAFKDDRQAGEVDYAEGRRPDQTYLSKTFPDPSAGGVPARFVHKVIDPISDTVIEATEEDGTQWLVHESPTGRVQLKLLVSGSPGNVTKIMIQRVDNLATGPRIKNVATFQGDEAARVVELLRNIEYIPVEGGATSRVDDATVRAVFSTPEAIGQIYERDPEFFRALISDDAAAHDVIAMRRRRTEVEWFRTLLTDDDAFDAAVVAAPGKSPEKVWQMFFELNPWILGAGLGAQLYSSWDRERLEQVVGGSSMAHEGKRADAVMRTSGVVRWMTFAEFKTHRTNLLGPHYRPGVYAPSGDIAAGIAQSQGTVRRAIEDIGEALRERAEDGSEIPTEVTFLMRPRSYLLIGMLRELLGEGGGPNVEKIRSFELFRRSVVEPEIVTFDELLARAEWLVGLAGTD